MSSQDTGQQLRDYRHDDQGRVRVSAQELAEELGYAHRSTITRYETGATPMTAAKLLKMCGAIEEILDRQRTARTPADILPAAR